MNKQFPAHAECEASFTARAFTDSSFIKMVLRNIEMTKYKKAETTLKDSEKVQLEHVLPRNPAPIWGTLFQNEKEMREKTYRFGNFTLLYQGLNEKARNGPFSDKKKHYGKSEIGLTKALTLFERWTSAEIDARTKELFNFAKEIWPIVAK